ncbi:MAG: DUF4270 domain-containing protein [Paludibacteraceae bacterium]|nr:DUF4270 domain-containing protein [Paludibacteraceae bacterium]
MKFQSFFIVILLSVLAFACTDDYTDIGSAIQLPGDTIIVDAKSLNLQTENIMLNSIYSRPDSFLLGTFVDNISNTGTTYADIFAQFMPPVDFSYPEGSKADSIKLFMYYYSWFGDQYSPMQVNLYEMNKGNIFNYSQAYQSNLKPEDYVDPNNKILLGSRIFTAKDAVIPRSDTTAVVFKLSDNFKDRFSTLMHNRRFNDIASDTANNISKFHKLFNGIYITTDFGSASMLYVRSIVLRYYFSYKYLAPGDTTSTTVSTYVNYAANPEVRQINRFQHPKKEAINLYYNSRPEVNLISSPANIYTKIKIPLEDIKKSISMGNRKLIINSATLRVDATDVKDTTLAQPLARNLLLVNNSLYDEFFRKRQLPTDSTAILASLSYELDSVDRSKYNYYYSFDMAKMISTTFKNQPEFNGHLEMMLVPVSLTYDGNNNVIEIKHQNTMSTTKIRSGAAQDNPMKLKMVYSGF